MNHWNFAVRFLLVFPVTNLVQLNLCHDVVSYDIEKVSNTDIEKVSNTDCGLR